MKTINTKYGTLTNRMTAFGYGSVWVTKDGHIEYADICGYKIWKTVRGFEKWADKQNVCSNGVYQPID